jgi:hypothetical protein
MLHLVHAFNSNIVIKLAKHMPQPTGIELSQRVRLKLSMDYISNAEYPGVKYVQSPLLLREKGRYN